MMTKRLKTLVVIPARKGSSLKGKNHLLCNGKSLLELAILSARGARDADIMVSTDCGFAEEVALKHKCLVHKRTKRLADDKATLDQVMFNIAQRHKYDLYICLPPTSPCRTAEHVRRALILLSMKKATSLVSVTKELRSIYQACDGDFVRPIISRGSNRQEVEDPAYIANGAIFIAERDIILKLKKKCGGSKMAVLPMYDSDSIDVHTEWDISHAEFCMK